MPTDRSNLMAFMARIRAGEQLEPSHEAVARTRPAPAEPREHPTLGGRQTDRVTLRAFMNRFQAERGR